MYHWHSYSKSQFLIFVTSLNFMYIRDMPLTLISASNTSTCFHSLILIPDEKDPEELLSSSNRYAEFLGNRLKVKEIKERKDREKTISEEKEKLSELKD